MPFFSFFIPFSFKFDCELINFSTIPLVLMMKNPWFFILYWMLGIFNLRYFIIKFTKSWFIAGNYKEIRFAWFPKVSPSPSILTCVKWKHNNHFISVETEMEWNTLKTGNFWGCFSRLDNQTFHNLDKKSFIDFTLRNVFAC